MGDFDSQAKMFVRVRKDVFIVKTRQTFNFGPNVVFNFRTVHTYIYIYIYKIEWLLNDLKNNGRGSTFHWRLPFSQGVQKGEIQS